ncbi:Zn-ribbon domain-containing OB-fold protein [Brucella cytisi]|uniref:Zn-ribbon domain-containing OB-fold protein n=1 Tax=Brucella cytisi TaxID=407152 RepID=UPI0035D98BC1
MSNYTKPLPQTDPVTAPFWESLKQQNMEIQRCDDCATFIFYPRALCTNCSSRQLKWTPVSGRGHIYTMTIVHKAPGPFKAEAPYVVALVELDEGCRMMTNIVGTDPDPSQVKIGMPVEIVYDDVTENVTLPKFRPIAD